MFAEWEKQNGVVLIYPHRFCDFYPDLESVQDCFDLVIEEILKVEDLILIIHPRDMDTKARIGNLAQKLHSLEHVCHCVEIESNDIWARDCMPISIKRGKNTQTITNIANAILGKGKWNVEDLGHFGRLIEQEREYKNDEYLREFANFNFNGWGLKFPANLDNQINVRLHKMGFFNNMKSRDMVLEGGSVDSNGSGIVLTTTRCLLESNRNTHLSKDEIEDNLRQYLCASKILWLHHGFLEGDNTTDGHIDTLARFISKDTIAYIKCEDSNDRHFDELNKMEMELMEYANEYGFKLVALPLCIFQVECKGIDFNVDSSSLDISIESNNAFKSLKESNAKVDSNMESNMRYLPASYINFLFLNNKRMIFPIYNKPTDSIAVDIMQNALPDYKIIPIDCSALIGQEGSIHCASMQFH